MATTGRPLKFQTLEALKTAGDTYFDETPITEWTITGLALALDTSRRVLIEYENKDEFSNTIKRYKTMVENAYEVSLRKNGRAGDIFGLKNFGWRDKNETDITTNGKDLPSPILGGIAKNVQPDDSNEEDSQTQ